MLTKPLATMNDTWSVVPTEYGAPITRENVVVGEEGRLEEVCCQEGVDEVDGLADVIPPPLQRELFACLVDLLTRLSSWMVKKMTRRRDEEP